MLGLRLEYHIRAIFFNFVGKAKAMKGVAAALDHHMGMGFVTA